MLIRAVGVALLVSLGAQSTCGAETASAHTINGRTADDVFSDPDVARLASLACAGDEAGLARLAGTVNPNFVGLNGTTPLFWALDCRSLRGVEALLRMGANPNLSTGQPGGYTPVIAAASFEDPAFLATLLRHGGDPNAKYEQDGTTVLQRAFQLGLHGGSWENWEVLLDSGANINAVRGERETIAIFAADLNRFDRVVELLERGYSHDLTYLGFVVQPLQHETPFPVPPLSPEREEARARAMSILAQRGVRFPVQRADVGLDDRSTVTGNQ